MRLGLSTRCHISKHRRLSGSGRRGAGDLSPSIDSTLPLPPTSNQSPCVCVCVCVSAAVIFPAQSPKIPARNAGGGERAAQKASASTSASTKLFYSYTTRQFSFPICSGAIQNVFQLTEATEHRPAGQTLRPTNFRLFFRPPPHPPSAIKKKRKSRHFSRLFFHSASTAFEPITSRPQFIPVMILPSLTPHLDFFQHFFNAARHFCLALAARRLSMSAISLITANLNRIPRNQLPFRIPYPQKKVNLTLNLTHFRPMQFHRAVQNENVNSTESVEQLSLTS